MRCFFQSGAPCVPTAASEAYPSRRAARNSTGARCACRAARTGSRTSVSQHKKQPQPTRQLHTPHRPKAAVGLFCPATLVLHRRRKLFIIKTSISKKVNRKPVLWKARIRSTRNCCTAPWAGKAFLQNAMRHSTSNCSFQAPCPQQNPRGYPQFPALYRIFFPNLPMWSA